MELDRDLVVQVGITVAVVAAFVVGLAVLSGVYGDDVTLENEPLDGTIDGHYEDVDDDTLNFDGTFENGIEAMVEGTITGQLQNGSLDEGQFEGEISGAIDGTASGTVTDVTVDQEELTLEGEFDGSANGTTAKELSEQGGLVLLGLLVAFLIAMPLFGYLIMRLQSDE